MNTVRFACWGCTLFLATGLGASACASQASEAPGTTGGGATGTGGGVSYNTGGTTGSGSNQATGSTQSTGSTTATGGGSGTYTFVGTVTPAPGTTAIAVPSNFVSCASPVPTDGGIQTCQYANCVPSSLADSLMSAEQKTLLGMCSDGTSYCVPDDFIATLGKFVLKTCTSISGAEGRCISTCVPQVSKMINELPQDVCDETERCAPCYYPWPVTSGDGQTGACTAGVGDAPTQPAVLFATCGVVNGGAPQGLCVPASLVPADLVSAVPQDTCKTGELCAPTQKVMDLNYKFPSCTGLLGAGGCVPKYLALYAGGDPNSGSIAAGFATCSSLGVTGLPAGNDWVCAPCTNPISTPPNQPTGACL